MNDVFVVADAHGNAQQVLDLLELAGAYPAEKNRPFVLQLGDLANCVASSTRDDLEALDLVHAGVIDLMLVGNHEHPYFGGGGFGGYWPDPEVRRSLLKIAARGGLRAAFAWDDILVSHAGLTSYWLREFGAWEWSAEQIAERTNATWEQDPRALIFNACGRRRGGWYVEGGILWADWKEPKPRGLKQLVGHTVGQDIRRRAGATCIDLGGGKMSNRIAGAWIREGGEIEVVIHAHEEKIAA